MKEKHLYFVLLIYKLTIIKRKAVIFIRKITRYTLIFALIAIAFGTSFSLAQDVSACMCKDGFCQGFKNSDMGLVPDKMKQQWRNEHREQIANMSDEDKAQLKQQRRDQMEQSRDKRHAAMEELVGLTHDQIREARQAGQTLGEILS